MKKLGVGTAVLVAFIILVAAPAGAQDDKAPTIKEVMAKLHKGANAPLGQVKKDLQADKPDWKEVQKLTKDFVILGAALAKNDPPKGEKGSWERLAKSYFDDSKTMDDAATKEDKAGTLAAQGKLAGSCMACHKAHRGK
jgi:cytochrome c556